MILNLPRLCARTPAGLLKTISSAHPQLRAARSGDCVEQVLSSLLGLSRAAHASSMR